MRRTSDTGIARDDFLGVAIVLERRGVGDRAIKLTSSQLSQVHLYETEKEKETERKSKREREREEE